MSCNKELRRSLSSCQNHRCCWCGEKCNEHKNHDLEATIEHVIPKDRGGSGHRRNLVMACRRCNTIRGNDINRSVKEILTETVEPWRFTIKRSGRVRRYIRMAKKWHEQGWLDSKGDPLDKNVWFQNLRFKGIDDVGRQKVHDAVFRGIYE